jgi:hypothetical protein
VRYVCNHHRLDEEQRIVLLRTIVSAETALSRMAKTMPLDRLRNEMVSVDGYNVLITAESLLAGFPVYLCDDGFWRDTRGFFRSFRASQVTICAFCEVLNLLTLAMPSRVEVLLDQQISRSGELARELRRLMAKQNMPGDVTCARDVDHQLKVCGSIVASSDGSVIDAAKGAIDIPGEIARRRSISPVLI